MLNSDCEIIVVLVDVFSPAAVVQYLISGFRLKPLLDIYAEHLHILLPFLPPLI